MLVGYMRVSTIGDRQVLDLQRDALLAAFQFSMSTAANCQSGLQRATYRGNLRHERRSFRLRPATHCSRL
jgi:hypothetical protein